eukprot:TRINITY_DN695_c0_g1_i1.p1 TRINITY_DN695_c0_g1~~TRINITY_DN695_c0_g1_i1.p1  ORF type:complete len:412 (-),score=169.66 TRINITY_DN695_c0_g1_i1:99-1271(-)
MKFLGLFAVIFLIYVSSASADNCGVCKNVAATVKTLLANNQTSAQIEAEVLKVCSMLGPYSAQCTTLVQQNFATLIALVEKYDDPAVVCQLAGLCPKVLEQVGNFDKCSICHFLVGVGESWIESNSTEQDIFKVLDTACDIIPGAYSAVCKKVIEQYGPQLVKALLNRENPDTLCKQIRLCTATLMKDVAAAPVFSPAELNVKGAGECYVCKLVVGYVENFVKSNSSEQEIIQEAEKVCGILPSSLKTICDNFVDNYIPQVINLLLQKVPPASICSYLKLCTASANRIMTVAQAQQVGNTQYCQICQFVVTTAENFLSSSTTESEITTLADKVCTVLPSQYSQLCKQFVDDGLPLAIKYILAKESPQVACAQIKLCTSAKTDFIKMSIQH